MGDCPGAGSGEWQDYYQPEIEEREERKRHLKKWMKEEIEKCGYILTGVYRIPKKGEFYAGIKYAHEFMNNGIWIRQASQNKGCTHCGGPDSAREWIVVLK